MACLLPSRKRCLTSIFAFCLISFCAVEANADVVLAGVGDLSINGMFTPGVDFIIEFTADLPAIDMNTENSRGLFVGTTTLTLADPSLGVTGLELTNINALC